MGETPAVYAIATMDTKGAELAYLAGAIESAGVRVVRVDVGTGGAPAADSRPDIEAARVAAHHRSGPDAVETARRSGDRGTAVAAMSEALVEFLRAEHAAGRVLGAIGIGGSGGTALISPALRALPVGLPKLMVSTVASGQTAAYVGCSDLLMMPSVVDVAGLNAVSRRILSNAALAIAGMVRGRSETVPSTVEDRPALGLTMFGVTTPCVDQVRRDLEGRGFDPLVFHATGVGGRAMEGLVDAGLIRGVFDVTTTEVADEVVGGVFPAGPDRFDVILKRRVPYVLSLGALDMVNFGARDTVPERFRDRKLHVHNPQVTLMRTTPEENRAFGAWIAAKLNRSEAPLTLLVPEDGVSALDAPGKPFWDPEADAALFEALERALVPTSERRIVRLPYHINDPEFALALVSAFLELWPTPTAGTR